MFKNFWAKILQLFSKKQNCRIDDKSANSQYLHNQLYTSLNDHLTSHTYRQINNLSDTTVTSSIESNLKPDVFNNVQKK